jgi:glycosyltransferase involved in cell wall biosynthesis
VEYSIYRNSFFGLNRFKYRSMADAYIAISDRVRQVLVSDGVPEQMIRVVPSGVLVDPGKVDPNGLMAEFGFGRDHRILLSVAHLTPEKGHDVLLRAMKRVLDRTPAARLMIVGDGRGRAGLETLADRLGIRQSVLFTGFRDDVTAFFGLAEVFISSSTAEGLGSSVLDALAAGVPVVATAVGGIPEVIVDGKTGILVPPSEPRALAQGIIAQLERADRAREMAARGRAVLRERFSVEKMVSGTLQVYRELLSDSCHVRVGRD